MRSFLLVAATSALLLFTPVSLVAAPDPAQSVQAADQPIEFRLPNGLQVVLITDHRAPVVTQSIWYKVGATDDPPHSHGLAHFLEHMMFKGTDKYPAGVFNEVVSRIGGAQNAATSDSYTYYYQIVPKAHLEQMMEMEADRMTNLRMNDSEVASERTVILQERRGSIDDNYMRRLFIEAHQALYGDHPLSTDLIGSQEEILAFKREDALAFYHRHYAPGNAVLVIAGDVTEAELRQLLDKTYSRIPATDVPKDRPVFKPLPMPAIHSVSITDAHAVHPTAWLLYRIPGLQELTHREYAALALMGEIIGSDTGRLRKTLVIPGIALEASSSFSGGFISGFSLGAAAAANTKLAQVEDELYRVIAELIRDGVTQDELDLARASYVSAEIYRMDYQSSLAGKYGNALMVGFSVEKARSWIDEIKAVRVEDVNAVARKYLVENMRVLAEAWPATSATTGAPSPMADNAKATTAVEGAK